MAAASALDLLTFDAAYLRALHQNDPAIERHFFSYFMPLINRKLRKHLRAPELIQEAAQETLSRVLAAVRSCGRVRHPEKFDAFVRAVCRNVVLETWRREKRFVALDEAKDKMPAPFRCPHAMAEAAETSERVRNVLASLPKFDRQLLEAVFLNEEDRLSVCRRFGVSEGYLRVLVHRAKRRFIDHLA
jgi:RNA polymerase sigma factor (sigma-70 family)